MKVILFGASGMVGRGVLRECLLDPAVDRVLVVAREPLGVSDPKVEELIVKDFFDYAPVEARLRGWDACFFCLGVSSAGMSEADYTRVTHDLTLAAATVLARLNPTMTFIYVSGAGTGGGSMWARVKKRTEDDLLAMPFARKVMFRPGFIQPRYGAKSKTRLYRFVYAVTIPFYPLLRLMRGWVTSTDRVGRAMIRAATEGAPKDVLETRDINALSGSTDTRTPRRDRGGAAASP
jgi:uncharacterized protein YbjT (DUF2867 family)